MKVFAIIVTYNAMRRQWIKRCLDSLDQSSVPVVPIVVDNGSSDGTRDYVPAHYPNVVWLPQVENLGFGQANNVGFRYALQENADFVLLLNQDASLHPKALEYMLEASDGKSLLSPLHLNGTGTAFDYNFRKNSFPVDGGIIEDLLVHGHMATVYEAGEICAACWLLPISIIKTIGGFNPVFFQYSEDNNYYDRMYYHGIRTLLVPRAMMYHDRIHQGNEQMFNKKQLRRMLTVAAYDINNSFKGCLKEFYGQLVLCYKYKLLHGLYVPGCFIYETIRLMVNIRNIRASREKERKISPNWL